MSFVQPLYASVEIKLPNLNYTEDSDHYFLKLNNLQQIQIQKNIDFEELAKSADISIEQAQMGYDSLSADEKLAFHQKRLKTLSAVTQILYHSRFSFGVGRVVGSTFQFIKKTIVSAKDKTMGLFKKPSGETKTSLDKGPAQQTQIPIIHADDLFQDLVQYNQLTELERNEIQKNNLKQSLKEKNRLTIESVVQAIDHKLWYQAPLFIKSNEFTVSTSLGILAEGGFNTNGYGGSEDIGLAFSFNDELKAIVFEIYHSSEKFLKSDMAVAVVGLNLKLSLSMYSRNLERPTETLRGEFYYPPAIPASNGFGPQFFTVGFGSSLGLPPPPLADLLTYTNLFQRVTWLRLSVSPLMSGFIRLQKGELSHSYLALKTRFLDALNAFSKKWSHSLENHLKQNGINHSKLLCSHLFE